MPADIFVDTNILVYAHDRDAGAKHEQACARLKELWRADEAPWLSVQVLQEFFVNLCRLGVPLAEARERWRVSFWDALILAAAREAGAKTLWSEDINPGQDYGGSRVVNPLG